MTGSVVVAPFSNSDVRDWPAAHFAEMIGRLVERWDGVVRVVGAPGQRTRADAIVRDHDAERVRNDCGRLSWPEVIAEVRGAACVIGNNSGIAHLSAYLGVPTVCVFGGSHQRLEWRPGGPDVLVVTRAIGCSPCHLDHGRYCPYDKACLRQIAPAEVADAALALLAAPASRAA